MQESRPSQVSRYNQYPQPDRPLTSAQQQHHHQLPPRQIAPHQSQPQHLHPASSTAHGSVDPSTIDLNPPTWPWSFDSLAASCLWPDPPVPLPAQGLQPRQLYPRLAAFQHDLDPAHPVPAFDPYHHARQLALRQPRPNPDIHLSASNTAWNPALAQHSAVSAAVMSVASDAPHSSVSESSPAPFAPHPVASWLLAAHQHGQAPQMLGHAAAHMHNSPVATDAKNQTDSRLLLQSTPIQAGARDTSTTAPVGPVRHQRRKRSAKTSDPGKASTSLWKGRSGPLNEETREKSRSLRQYGACWRCRKYRKPCSSGPDICETCVTSGFRVWPSELGCRRGNLDAYVDVFLPTNAEFVFQSSPIGTNKKQPWRQVLNPSAIVAAQSATALTTEDKRWGMLIRKALGTRIFGVEFVELFEIVAKYQQRASNEHPALDAACDMLDATTDFYYTFVQIDGEDTQMHDPLRTVRTIRKSFSRALRMILNACLSGRANEWLPCLLACCMLAAAVVCFTDAACQIPPEVRQAIWPDVGSMVQSIKGSLYPIIVLLLGALAKGGRPLKMTCWRVDEIKDEATGEIRTERNENGMKLLAHDEPSFDGVRALQSWLQRHGSVVTIGRVWSSSVPFSQNQIPAIAIMGALFDA